MATFTLLAAPAMAVGETYTWNSATDSTTITGAGGAPGSYTKDVTFTRTSAAANGATYVGTATYRCLGDTTDRTAPLTLTLDASNYNNGTPSSAVGTITGAAACADITDANIFVPGAAPIATGNATAAAAPTCDQGSLTWLFCPVIDNVSETISKFASQDVLKPLLEVNAITPTNTPKLYQVWTHMRDLADVLFILVFLAIIASTLMEQDIGGLNPYTIKSIWIRLILAAIGVQFSFLASGLIVDIGNVTGAGVGSFINFLADPSKGTPSLTNYFGNLLTGSVAAVGIGGIALLATWEIALPVLASLMIGLLVVFLTLGARFLIISVLIAISPLAFVAWVLPNTRHYMDDWGKVLMRLVMMYPIIVGIISIAGVVNEILPFSNQTSATAPAAIAAGIIKPLITIAAFLIIPTSFKLAGRGLERAYGFINGAGSGARGLLKNTQMYKDGQEARHARKSSLMQGLASSDKVKSFTESNSRLKRIGGKGLMTASGLALAGAASSPVGIQKASNKAEKERNKSLKEFENIPPNLVSDALLAAYGDKDKLAEVRKKAPALLSYTNTLAGRTALATRASEAGVFTDETFRYILNSSRASEISTLQNGIDKNNYKEKPHLHRMTANGIARVDYAGLVESLTASSMNAMDRTEFIALIGRQEKRADGTIQYTPDARSKSFIAGWVSKATPAQIGAFFDPSNRNFGSREKRSALLQAIGQNQHLFTADTNGRAIIAEVKAKLNKSIVTDSHPAGDYVNKDILKDYYDNIAHTMKPWADGLDPQNSDADRDTMLADIISRLP